MVGDCGITPGRPTLRTPPTLALRRFLAGSMPQDHVFPSRAMHDSDFADDPEKAEAGQRPLITFPNAPLSLSLPNPLSKFGDRSFGGGTCDISFEKRPRTSRLRDISPEPNTMS